MLPLCSIAAGAAKGSSHEESGVFLTQGPGGIRCGHQVAAGNPSKAAGRASLGSTDGVSPCCRVPWKSKCKWAEEGTQKNYRRTDPSRFNMMICVPPHGERSPKMPVAGKIWQGQDHFTPHILFSLLLHH